MPTPLPPSGTRKWQDELTQANTLTTGSRPGTPGVNTYVANDAAHPIPVTGNLGVNVNLSGVTLSASFSPNVAVTSSVPITATITNLPLTQSVFVVNQTSGTVVISGTASVSVSNWPAPVTQVTASVSNLPATQSVYVVNSQGSSVNVTQSIPLQVTSTVASPVWVTGNLGVTTYATQSVTGSVGIVGTVAISQTNVPATQSVYVVNSQGSNVAITSSIPLQVTASMSFPASQAVVVSNTGAIVVSISGGLSVSGSFSSAQPKTPTITSASYGTASVLLVATNTSRLGLAIYNDTSSSNYLLAFGLTASLGLFSTVVGPGWTYESLGPVWQGPVAGIGADPAGSGTIYVTEMV